MHRLTLVLALVPHAADAKCARTERVPKVLTTRDTKLPDDGGILVGWQNQVYDDSGEHNDGDPSDQPKWTAAAGKQKVALVRTSLAPGLSVYVPAKFTGTLVLHGKTDLGSFTRDGKTKNTMSAPVVTKDELSEEHERWSERHAKATLKSAPPPEAVALITYAGGKAIAFVTLPDTHDTLLELDTFQDSGHCGSVPPGGRPPSANEKVTFAWVDAFGRVSPQSAAVTAK